MTSEVRPSPNPACSTKSSIAACIEACECITPLDSPVVPEVKASTAMSSASPAGGGDRAPSRAAGGPLLGTNAVDVGGADADDVPQVGQVVCHRGTIAA